jgi:hypothetical protein
MMLHERRGVLLVQTRSTRVPNAIIYALESTTLRQISHWGPAANIGGLTMDSHEPRAYALSYRGLFGCQETRLEALRIPDLAYLGGVPALGSPTNTVTGACGQFGTAAAPAAPPSLSASVTGNMVTLEWSAPPVGLATDYLLEVGSTSGATDLLATRLGARQRLVASAPPGTYYVRLRGINAIGAGPPSRELLVVVP